MERFTRGLYTYKVYEHPTKKKKSHRKEYIKYETGFRNLWQRISEEEYLKAKNRTNEKL